MRMLIPAMLLACSTLLSCGGDTPAATKPAPTASIPTPMPPSIVKNSTFHVVTTGVNPRIAAFFAEEVRKALNPPKSLKVWDVNQVTSDYPAGVPIDAVIAFRDPTVVPKVPVNPKNSLGVPVVIINADAALTAGQYAVNTKDATPAISPEQLHDIETGKLSVKIDDYKALAIAAVKVAKDHITEQGPAARTEVPPLVTSAENFKSPEVQMQLAPRP